jgi:hypothetical protein
MVTQNMVDSLPKVLPPNGVFRGCILDKRHQAPFDSGSTWCMQNQLELVHSDMCCVNKTSLTCVRCILTFINEFSRFTWVYFLNNKNLSFEKLKDFRALAEKQCGQPIKCLRLDNSEKYVSR